MKSHTNESILPANPQFHLLQTDGVFVPIAFVFVTERMCQDIVHERQAILDALPPACRAVQQKVFERYDPHGSVRAFENILALFGVGGRR